MRLIFLIFVAGCCLGCGDSEALTVLKTTLRDYEETVVKRTASVEAKTDESLTILRDNTTALAAIKSQVESLGDSVLETRQAIGTMESSLAAPKPQQLGGDPAAQPQGPATEPKHTPSSVVSVPAVSLFVTYAEFHCPPCEQLRDAVSRGDFAGFEVIESQPFDGQKSYPAVRYQNRDGQWKVRYGYDARLPQWIRNDIETTNRFVSQPIITNPVVPHGDLVSMHNQLHGGGNWTWPGDLATHLRESHGVQTGGQQPVGSIFPVQRQSAVVSSRTTFRPVSQGSRFVGRSRTKVRASCPAGGCP